MVNSMTCAYFIFVCCRKSFERQIFLNNCFDDKMLPFACFPILFQLFVKKNHKQERISYWVHRHSQNNSPHCDFSWVCIWNCHIVQKYYTFWNPAQNTAQYQKKQLDVKCHADFVDIPSCLFRPFYSPDDNHSRKCYEGYTQKL